MTLPTNRHFDCMKRCQNGDAVCSSACARLAILANLAPTPFPAELKWVQQSHAGQPYTSAWIAFDAGSTPGTAAKVAEWVQVHGDNRVANAAFIGQATKYHPRMVDVLRRVLREHDRLTNVDGVAVCEARALLADLEASKAKGVTV